MDFYEIYNYEHEKQYFTTSRSEANKIKSKLCDIDTLRGHYSSWKIQKHIETNVDEILDGPKNILCTINVMDNDIKFKEFAPISKKRYIPIINTYDLRDKTSLHITFPLEVNDKETVSELKNRAVKYYKKLCKILVKRFDVTHLYNIMLYKKESLGLLGFNINHSGAYMHILSDEEMNSVTVKLKSSINPDGKEFTVNELINKVSQLEWAQKKCKSITPYDLIYKGVPPLFSSGQNMVNPIGYGVSPVTSPPPPYYYPPEDEENIIPKNFEHCMEIISPHIEVVKIGEKDIAWIDREWNLSL